MELVRIVFRLLSVVFTVALPHIVGAQIHLHGKVVSTEGGEIPGAHIQMSGVPELIVSQVDGSFFVNLPKGEYQLTITSVGFDTLFKDVNLVKDEELWVELTPSSLQLDQVLVEGHQGLGHQALNKVDIDQQRIRQESATNLSLALSSQPGLRVQSTGAGIGKPVIRGMTSNRVQVNSNGIKQEGQQWGSDHGLEIDPFQADEVQVVKGPSALRFGSDATAGVIQVKQTEIPDTTGLRTDITTFYRSNNDQLGVHAKAAGKWNKWFLFGGYTRAKSSDLRVPANEFVYNDYVLPIYDEKLKNTALNEQHAFVRLGREFEWGNSQLTYSRYDLETGLFPGAMGVPRAYNLQPDDDRDIDLPKQRIYHDNLIWNTSAYWDKTIAKLDVGYQLNDRNEFARPHNHGVTFIDPSDVLALNLRLQTITANAVIEQEITDELEIEYGIQSSFLDNEIDGFEYLIPAYQQQNVGGFAMAAYDVTGTITLSGGLRYDAAFLQADGGPARIRDVNGELTEVIGERSSIDRTFSSLSGALGLAWDLTEHYEQKFNVARTFRTPNIAELASDGIHHGTFRHERGAPIIDPEIGYQFDWNHTYQTKAWNVSLSLFTNYFTNYIFLSPSPFFSRLPDGGQVYQYLSTEAFFAGAEWQVQYAITNHFTVGHQLDGVYAQNLQTELPLPFIPPLRNAFTASYRDSKKITWEIGATYTLVSEQDRVERNEQTTPSYNLLSAWGRLEMSSWRVPIVLLVSIQNALDEQYFDHLSRYRQINVPEPGRNVGVSLTVPLQVLK